MNLLEELLFKHSPKRVPKEIYPFRVYNLLKTIGFNPDKAKYIHITGSKGKGSLAFNTTSLLRQQHKVGLFTSPHILQINERFIINDKQINNLTLKQLILQYNPYFEDLHFFEICLFLALIYFLNENCEYIVLEVGVGGRFDPTNFCQPILSLLGHISIEHKDFLGDTIEKIAYDKAGIIKKNIPALSVCQSSIVKNILQQEGQVFFYEDIITISNHQEKELLQQFDLTITLPQQTITLPNIILNRVGKAHLINFVLAVAGLVWVIPDFDRNWVYHAMKEKLNYRMDVIQDKIMIDTAHNGASFENLLQSLQQIKWNPIILYIAILQGKEITDIAEKLIQFKKIIHHIEFFEFDTTGTRKTNSLSLYELTKDSIPCNYQQNIEQLILDNNYYQVFTGSFYGIKDILKLIQNQKA